MEKNYIEFIQDVLISIHQNIHELNERKSFADAHEMDHIEGKLMAYKETLAILKMSAESFNIPAKEIGI